MITFDLSFINTLLALIGAVGWGWVWWFDQYKTGRTIRTQIGVIIFGVIWVLLYFADTVQHLMPTSFTVISRLLLLIALWCCMPLLKKEGENQ